MSRTLSTIRRTSMPAGERSVEDEPSFVLQVEPVVRCIWVFLAGQFLRRLFGHAIAYLVVDSLPSGRLAIDKSNIEEDVIEL